MFQSQVWFNVPRDLLKPTIVLIRPNEQSLPLFCCVLNSLSGLEMRLLMEIAHEISRPEKQGVA